VTFFSETQCIYILEDLRKQRVLYLS